MCIVRHKIKDVTPRKKFTDHIEKLEKRNEKKFVRQNDYIDFIIFRGKKTCFYTKIKI